jgi:hypothetical protein
MLNKKLIFPVIALAVLGFTLLDVNLASADNSENYQKTIVQKIAEKFNLNQDEVQKVFDEVRSERQAEMEAEQQEQLTQLISEGKITEEQKTLIENKQKELRENMESEKDNFKNLTHEERRAQMEEKRSELETWANENGIDVQYLMPFGGKGHDGPGPRLNRDDM